MLPPRPFATHVDEINDPQSLAKLRLVWTQLLGQTRAASFFQTLDWLLIYWKHFGADQKLRVLVVHAAGRPIGILPLVVRMREVGFVRVRALTYPLADWGTFYGPIGPNPTATLHVALAHIQNRPHDWDYIELPWIDSRVDHGRSALALKLSAGSCQAGLGDDVAMIDLAGDWNSYLAARGHKTRTNLRRSERLLAEQGSVRLVRHRPLSAAEGDGDPRWDLYDICEQIAKRSWQGASTSGISFAHASVRAFLREVHAAAARLGAVDMSILYLNDAPVAFVYNYLYNGELFGLRNGFDAAVTRAGAGCVLLARVIEDSFRRGDRCFNLGADYLQTKRHWLTHCHATGRCAYYPRASLKAQAVRIARTVRRWSKQASPATTRTSSVRPSQSSSSTSR
jgi:CelD/BcsL family acetyltransferase involved in cellulose biosynthesis